MNAFQVTRNLALMGGQLSERATATALDVAERFAALGLAMVARQRSIDKARLRTAASVIATIDRASPDIARQVGNATATSIVVAGRIAVSAVQLSLLTAASLVSTARARANRQPTRPRPVVPE
jgi:hypothetical protein